MNKGIKRRLSWISKLIILYIVVMGIMLLTQIFYIAPHIRDRDLGSAESYQEEISKNISFIINNKILKFREELLNIAGLPEFLNMDIEAHTPILVNQKNIDNSILNLFIMDSEGWFVSSSVEDLSPWQKQSWDDLPPYKFSFIKGETYYSTPSYFESVGEISFYMTIPIESAAGERVGVLMGTMLLNDLIEMIYSYDLKDGVHVMLVNNEGIVIASSGMDLYTLEDGPLSLGYSGRPDMQALIKGNTGSFIDEREGIAYLHSVSPILSNGWEVIVETPMDVLMAETRTMSRFLWLINGILFIVPLIILIIFSRQIDLERARSEEELIRKEKLSVLGQLSGGVAHELRNPLTTIKNASYFLNTAIKKPEPEIKRTLGILDEATSTSEDIISSILSLANPRTPIKKKVNIGNMLQDIIIQATIPDNIKVLNKLDKSMPAVLTDPGQIKTIFSNIILNAVQAMPEGGKLTVKYALTGKECLDISVSDTGPGIPAENIDKIFEPLFTTKAKGIGLGLALTKTLVDTLGGKISVKSRVGEGTTFTVALSLIAEK